MLKANSSIFGGDPPPPTADELKKANAFAKAFAIRKRLISGENTHVGNAIPQFIDAATGKIFQGSSTPPNVRLQKVIPSYVKELQWDDKMNYPYYIDEKTGDMNYVGKEWLTSNRFKPQRSILNYASR